MLIDLRRQFGKVMKNLAAKVAEKTKPTTGGFALGPKKAVLVQVTDRSRGIIAHQDGTKEDNTPLSRPPRTRRSSTRSPSTAWPS